MEPAVEVPTRRVVVPFLENLLFRAQPVLDHGFVRVIDYMGDDSAVVTAARVSRGPNAAPTQEDRALIRYLIRHDHTSPFEMCELKLHVKLPLFVARQWIRHRTASVNEQSGRFSVLGSDYYLPETETIAAQSSTMRQGRGDRLDDEEAQAVLQTIRRVSNGAYEDYQALLNDEPRVSSKRGAARELARIVLPLNFYTEWYWKIDLHNLLHFLELRLSSTAQVEIREYARLVATIVAGWVPMTYEAFTDYRIDGLKLSRGAVRALKRALAGDLEGAPKSGLSKGEWNELAEMFNLPR